MKHEQYNSYLVRLWRENIGSGAEGSCRSEVESIQTGQIWQFNSLEELSRFLQEGMVKMTRRDDNTRKEG